MKVLLRILFILFIINSFPPVALAKNCTPSKHAVLPNILGKTYHQARKQLIAKQWQPLRTLSHNSTQSDVGYGNAWGFWEKGYKEVESCAGTGTAPCVFNYKDVYGNILKVYTEGEEGDDYYAHVSGFQFECIR